VPPGSVQALKDAPVNAPGEYQASVAAHLILLLRLRTKGGLMESVNEAGLFPIDIIWAQQAEPNGMAAPTITAHDHTKVGLVLQRPPLASSLLTGDEPTRSRPFIIYCTTLNATIYLHHFPAQLPMLFC